MSAHTANPERITPRRLKGLGLSDAPRNWFGGDPFMTALFNAMSLVFPPGERYFMRSVRALSDQVRDPQLRRDVRGFLAQESLHSREHADFNGWLTSFGIDANRVMDGIDERLRYLHENRSPLRNLAITCALEHFTAIMAEAWLLDDDLRVEAHPAVRDLWTWHALEELEHRAVAFDVYQEVGGEYRTRATAMALMTLTFVIVLAFLQWRLLQQAHEDRNWRSIGRGLWRAWGPRGLFSSLIGRYAAYYAPGFHPNKHDVSELLTRFDAALRDAGAYEPVAAVV